MRTTLVAGLAALAAGTLAAPPAAASHQTVSCHLWAYSEPTVTAQDTWAGYSWGYIVDSVGTPVSIRCVVRVNGTVNAATAWGSGTGTATTGDLVTWTAPPTATMQLCAQYYGSHGPGETCFPIVVTPAGTGWIATA